MKTVFLPWEAFNPTELRRIEIACNEITLTYNNDSEVALAFASEEQLDDFVGHIVGSLIRTEDPERIQWN